MGDVETARRRYASELRGLVELRSNAVFEAFARVPRERFLGPGPWQIRQVRGGYELTPDADPVHVYRNVLVALVPEREINNGEPAYHARLIDRMAPRPGEHVVHVGSGSGYYTALLAELVGAGGRVTAFEIDEGLAERARTNLRDRPNVEVRAEDGTRAVLEAVDGIYVNAGCSHVLPVWLDALRKGARLIVPLTTGLWGGVLRVESLGDGGLAARFVSLVGIFPCVGGQCESARPRLEAAFARGEAEQVRGLRRDPHQPDATCWLHAEGACLSFRETAP